jgi:hypothetical protein
MMTDPTLTSAVAAQRALVASLETQLAPRRTAEAAQLDALAKEERDVLHRTATATEGIARATQNLLSLQQQRVALDRGLSAARRSWLRLGEPVIGSVLLLFGFVAIGMAVDHQLETSGLALLGFAIGTASWRLRR